MNPSKALEDAVNSPEAVEIVKEEFNWDALKALFEEKIGGPLGDLEDPLYRDLRDWWKNGNFYVWAEGETNAFGMHRWEMGDPDFWEQP